VAGAIVDHLMERAAGMPAAASPAEQPA
jgi:hypothetical protein